VSDPDLPGTISTTRAKVGAREANAASEDLHALDHQVYAQLQLPRDEAAKKLLESIYSIAMRTLFRIASVSLLIAAHAAGAAADTYPRQPGVDAVHYVFRLRLGDGSNEIAGEATATVRITAPGVQALYLDLTSPQEGKGMTVSGVTVAGKPVQHSHERNRLRIPLASPVPGSEVAVSVTYSGIPAGGLRLIDNIHGARSMFSENWPNNARHWLPAIDHPYDKATGEFIVTAPSYYQVVANGLLVSEIDRPDGERTTHWRQSVPIASWLFALGVARFSVHHYAVVRGIPQQVWSFPEDRETASGVFEFTGRRAFEFFSDWIGPYPYEKLAHVQAAGLGGGTEHASAIFYGENGVAAGRAPVVHEVAHQWWGNAVTERDWDDVWLSEGFATYFTHLFTEQFSGREAFVRGLRNDVNTILQAQSKLPEQAVIHRNIDDMRGVLNRFVYQKGGWVLHMLRGTIGTDAFWEGIREYYRRHRDSTASTSDLRQVMERVSGMDLRWFFDQWLTRPGMPKLAGTWGYDRAAGRIDVEIAQTQSGAPYRLPLDVGVSLATGASRAHRVEMTGARGTFTIPVDAEPASVSLDPNTWLLLESAELKRR
jgi:aminopeptidase N